MATEGAGKVWTRERWEKYRQLRVHWRRRRSRRWILLRTVRLGIVVLGALPLGLASAVGAGLGRVAGRVALPMRRRALDHIGMALGDRLTESERRKIIGRMFVNLGRAVGEHGFHMRNGPRVAIRSVTGYDGEEHLHRALEGGRGAVVVTPHFGHWELMATALLARFEGCIVGTQPRFIPAAGMMVAMRAAMGMETVSDRNARELLRRLRSNHLVGLLPDQDMNRLAGTFLPFFGRDAYTVTGPATLAWAGRCPVIPLACIRVGPHEHRVQVYPSVPTGPREGSRDEWIRETTRAVSNAMQEIIAAHPDHWVWFHERWKTTPADLERRRERRALRDARRTRRKLEAERDGNAVSGR